MSIIEKKNMKNGAAITCMDMTPPETAGQGDDVNTEPLLKYDIRSCFFGPDHESAKLPLFGARANL